MSFINELKIKIKNINSTEKITKAMEMVSTSKMRKAQETMHASRPFCTAVLELINNLSCSCMDKHDFFVKRPETNIDLLIVSSDRGLCGGLNINLFKKCNSYINTWKQNSNNVKIKLATIGEKAKKFFSTHNKKRIIKIVASLEQVTQKPQMQDLIGVIQVLLQEYENKSLDSVYIAYNEFGSIMKQKPIIKQILPIITKKPKTKEEKRKIPTEYIFEPGEQVVLDILLKRYIESLVYQGVVENIACEHSARMVAMKSATDNANQIIEDLQIYLNKERQAMITKEITEIVGGAG